MKRWKARDECFKILYQIDITRESPDAALARLAEQYPDDPAALEFVRMQVYQVLRELDRLDTILNRYAINWTVDRMATTVRNILRLALSEMLYEEEIPYEVSVTEAIKLSKRYADPQSEPFVNGVLGKFLEDQRLLGLPKSKL